jgi:hypothetical protein
MKTTNSQAAISITSIEFAHSYNDRGQVDTLRAKVSTDRPVADLTETDREALLCVFRAKAVVAAARSVLPADVAAIIVAQEGYGQASGGWLWFRD